MYWLATRNAVVSFPKLRSLSSVFLRSPLRNYSPFRPSTLLLTRRFGQAYCFKDRRSLRGITKSSKKVKGSNDNILSDKDLSHIMWWQERLQMCRKPSTLHLVNRLKYSNLLGLDVNLKNGSLKEGTLNWEMLQFKSKFPREVLLCRVGDFYEAIGIDACILVEYAGLNPFGGLRPESIPKAGCPVVNLRQTLDDLTRNGYSVCIVEEVQGPTQARSRKSRFMSGSISFCKGLLHNINLGDYEDILIRGWFDGRCFGHEASDLSVSSSVSPYLVETKYLRNFSLGRIW